MPEIHSRVLMETCAKYLWFHNSIADDVVAVESLTAMLAQGTKTSQIDS